MILLTVFRKTRSSETAEVARDRRNSEGYRQGYVEARRVLLIGQAVRERRRSSRSADALDQVLPALAETFGDLRGGLGQHGG